MLALQAQDIAAAVACAAGAIAWTAPADVLRPRGRRSCGSGAPRHAAPVAAEDVAWLTALRGRKPYQAMRRLVEEGITGTEADLVRETERHCPSRVATKAGQRLAALGRGRTGPGVPRLPRRPAGGPGPDRRARPTYAREDWLGAPPAVDRSRCRAGGAGRRYLRARGQRRPRTCGSACRRRCPAGFEGRGRSRTLPDRPLHDITVAVSTRRRQPATVGRAAPGFDSTARLARLDGHPGAGAAKRVVPGGMLRPVLAAGARGHGATAALSTSEPGSVDEPRSANSLTSGVSSRSREAVALRSHRTKATYPCLPRSVPMFSIGVQSKGRHGGVARVERHACGRLAEPRSARSQRVTALG
jgi:hypothetical protein